MEILVTDINGEYIDEKELSSFFPKRVKRAYEFADEKDRLRSLSGTYLINKIFPSASEKDLFYSKNGKPQLKNGRFFNISHSGDYAVIAVSDKEIGADIEKIKNKDIKNTAAKIFSQKDAEYIGEDVKKYYILWTMKESFYKTLGTGLFIKNKDIDFSSALKNLKTGFNGEEFYFKIFYLKDYVLTVCGKDEKVAGAELKLI